MNRRSIFFVSLLALCLFGPRRPYLVAGESDYVYTHSSVAVSSATSPVAIPASTGHERRVCFGELTGSASFYFKIGSTITVTTNGWLVKADAAGDNIAKACEDTVQPIAIQLPVGISAKTITYYMKER